MYGPVCMVVWEGEGCEAFPYPDFTSQAGNLYPVIPPFMADSDTNYGTARPKCCHCLVLKYQLQVVSFSAEKYMLWPVLSLANSWFLDNY